jgi:trehalose 6-phosphate synthase/phosphatase
MNFQIALFSSAGGLVTAVAPVVIKGKGQWVGWPGLHLPANFDDSQIPESDPSDQTPTAGLKSEQVSRFISSTIICSNKTVCVPRLITRRW